nr:hypothetical protein [Tanacetum cinerariifolium]
MVVVQIEDAPWCTAWTNEEEIVLCKDWVHVSENSAKCNARKTNGFWIVALEYLRNKIKQPGHRTYYMANGKQKSVCPNVARFCGVHINVMRKAHWKVLRHSPEWWDQEVLKFLTNKNVAKRSKTSGSSSFNMKSEDVDINLNANGGDDDEDGKEERTSFLKIKMRVVECREREIEMQDRQRQEDIRFYRQPYDHLIEDALRIMEAPRVEIRAKWNFPY